MFYYNQYIRAKSLEEAYELYQKRQNFIVGGMLWTKMKNTTLGTAIDLCELGLDGIEENENEFRIGAYVSLRDIETNESLNKYTDNAFADSVKDIVGVQFRNVATVGGSMAFKVEQFVYGRLQSLIFSIGINKITFFK